jgi:2-polyprenyl-3-methyl-5-hydroxy-6-metoxy-1,4-benzoquinol methylase
MKIEYRQAKNDAQYADFKNYLNQLIVSSEVKNICEVGGGANPAIPLDLIEKHGLEYTLLDISSEELAKAPNEYHKIQADISSPSLNLDGQFDLIFSMMVAEHIADGQLFHKNVWNLLRDGGYAFHLFPTMYALPFVVNQILPDELSRKILGILAPYRIKDTKKLKFPAYYSWCRGPLKNQLSKFNSLGFRVEEYIGFFGTPGYFRRIKQLNLLDEWVSSILIKYPNPLITSYAHVVLRKDVSLMN